MPVPVEAVRSLAPRLPVVAINLQNDYARRALAVGLRMEPKPALTSLSVLRSATGLMLSRLARQSLALHPPELELPLQVGHIDVRHFTRANELIEIGSHAIDERSEEHTSELQSLMRISYAVFCLKKKK